MTALALIILAALGVAAVVEMSIEAVKRRINTAFYEGFALGRADGIRSAGLEANVNARWIS